MDMFGSFPRFSENCLDLSVSLLAKQYFQPDHPNLVIVLCLQAHYCSNFLAVPSKAVF